MSATDNLYMKPDEKERLDAGYSLKKHTEQAEHAIIDDTLSGKAKQNIKVAELGGSDKLGHGISGGKSSHTTETRNAPGMT